MEQKILQTIDELLKHNINRNEALSQILSLYNSIPSLLYFKDRRTKLNMSLRDVAKKTGVSHATISRIERGNECDFGNVKALDEWYSNNGV